MVEDYKYRLLNNKLERIENRLRKIEILILKNIKSGRSIKKKLRELEKEEEIIEKEQKKLESDEQNILREIKRIENEEKWNVEVMYACSSKEIEEGILRCMKTGKSCSLDNCPLFKKK